MKRIRSLLAALPLLIAATAQAALERVGPVVPANGYPAWYQDKTGLTLEFCTPLNQAELNDGWCTILPADVPTGVAPEVFPTKFSGEHFYWIANAGSGTAGGGIILVLALEGAFAAGDPAPGDQIVFGRLRIKIATLPLSGDYKVYTPFGVYDFPGLVAGDKLFFTSDVGITCGTGFDCALNSAIGPFLLPSAVPGGIEVPPIPDLVKGSTAQPGPDPFYDLLAAPTVYPGTGRKYIADPARVGPLTGGTCTLTPGVTAATAVPGDCVMGNPASDIAGMPSRPVYKTTAGLKDPNIFRIEVNGVAQPIPGGGEHGFTTAGRVMTAAIAGRLSVDRASYGLTALDKKLDVFVTAFPSILPRLPAGGLTQQSSPDLGFYATACGTDAAGNPTAPTTTGVGGVPVTYYAMFHNNNPLFDTNKWWGQNAPLAIPNQVCVLDHNAKDTAGNVVPAYFPANVTDEVDITYANWDPTVLGGTLTIEATSSDTFTTPTLTVDGFGGMALAPATGKNKLIRSGLLAPPTRLSVTSTRGGVATREVRTGLGLPTLMNTVVANADTVTINEDCSATPATSCATPVVFDVLGNDTLNGVPVGSTPVTVDISGPPGRGTATVVSNQIRYTPNPNVNGADLVGYTVTYAGAVSQEGYLHITINPVNDAPTAVNDSSGAPNNKPITINVLANDTDPDGAGDLASAVIQSLPAAGATITCNGGAAVVIGQPSAVCAGGNITFTGSGGGSVYTFRYKARDVAGALSANTATVTMTVNATEAIVITKSVFTTSKLRWQLDGTDSLIAGQALQMQYDIATPPTYRINGVCTAMTAATNPVIATPVVDALGNWAVDTTVNSAGLRNPTNTGSNGTGFWCSPPRRIQITSPLGGTATSAISFK